MASAIAPSVVAGPDPVSTRCDRGGRAHPRMNAALEAVRPDGEGTPMQMTARRHDRLRIQVCAFGRDSRVARGLVQRWDDTATKRHYRRKSVGLTAAVRDFD